MTQENKSLDLTLCLILAHKDIGFAARASRQLRRHGWDVYLAQTGAEVRRLAKQLTPALVVLDVDLADESGWLLCDKLSREPAGPKVVLVAAQLTPQQERLASFVGATALIRQRDGIAALVNEVLESAVPAAG
jgi:DNA-binding response OmpR family regulator